MVQVDAVAFTADTAGGNQTITFREGFGTPKLVLFIAGRSPGDSGAHAGLSFGVATDTNQFCNAYINRNDRTSSRCRRRAENSHCIIIMNTSGAINGEAGWVSFQDRSVTINWTDAPGSLWKGTAVGFSGDDLNFKVGTVETNSTPGSTTVTTDFEVDQLLFFGDGTNFSDTAYANDIIATYGFCTHDYRTNETTQRAFALFDEDSLTVAQPNVYMNDNDCAVFMDGSNIYRYQCNTFTQSSFNVETISGGQPQLYFCYVALGYNRKQDTHVGSIIPPTSVRKKKEEVNRARPGVMMCIGTENATRGSRVTDEDAKSHSICIASDQHSAYYSYRHHDDGLTDSNTYQEYDLIGVQHYDGTGGMAAAMGPLENDGLMLDWTQVTGGVYIWYYTMFGLPTRRSVTVSTTQA